MSPNVQTSESMSAFMASLLIFPSGSRKGMSILS